MTSTKHLVLLPAGAIEPLVKTLTSITETHKRPTVYLALCKRNPDTFNAFLTALKTANLSCIDTQNLSEQWPVQFLDIWQDCSSELHLLTINMQT